jgi:uncharacterized membrane protein
MNRTAAAWLTAAAVLWGLLVVAAPYALAHGPALLALVVYQAGALICHQQSGRSFHLAGMQLPVCARCTGLYLSAAIGAAAVWLARTPNPSVLERSRVILVVAAVPTAATVAVEWVGLAHPSSVPRAIAALPLGCCAAWVIIRALRAGGAPLTVEQMRYHF